jgi:uncharacterized protein
MTAALLDVNVLIALFDPLHINHEDAHIWSLPTEDAAGQPARSPSMDAAGFSATPTIPVSKATPLRVVQGLRVLCGKPNHEFWPQDISMLDEERFHWERITGHRRITHVGVCIRAD